MKHWVENVEPWGKVLWLSNENAQVGVALEFGLRIVHLSCTGMENLFYVQPADCSDGFVEENGWRLRGGHRFWLSPETDNSYAPDNDPITYTLQENGVWLTQNPDPLLQVRKSIGVTFCDGEIKLEHHIENLANEERTWALWGVNTLDGGEAEIPFPPAGRGFWPSRTVSLWNDTNLHDPRVHFSRESLTVKYAPLDGYFKMRLGLAVAPAVLKSKGQQLEIRFDTKVDEVYSDKGCNFEEYMNDRFLELETLGTRCTLAPGAQASHIETWRIKPL